MMIGLYLLFSGVHAYVVVNSTESLCLEHGGTV